MPIYKVLKDFPSRNGVTQYKSGSSIELEENSRTKALVEMGFIEETRAFVGSEQIALALAKRLSLRHCKVMPLPDSPGGHMWGRKEGYKYYVIEIEEGKKC